MHRHRVQVAREDESVVVGLLADLFDEVGDLLGRPHEAGAVGDLCGYYMNADGQLIDHPLNRRVIGLSPDALRKIKTVILAGGGPDKVTVMRAALRMGTLSAMVTDERTAEAILAGQENVSE